MSACRVVRGMAILERILEKDVRSSLL
jgi:hypothetical protein